MKEMTHIKVAPTPHQTGFEDILIRVEQLEKPALLQFVGIVKDLVYKKNNTSVYEAQLVKKIKNSIPLSLKRHQKELYAKMQNNALTFPEKEELMLLNALIEEKTAEKIRLMGELSQLRHLSLEELNHQLHSSHA